MKFEIIERGNRVKTYQLRLIPESGIYQDYDIHNYDRFGAVPYVVFEDGKRMFLLPAMRKALYDRIARKER